MAVRSFCYSVIKCNFLRIMIFDGVKLLLKSGAPTSSSEGRNHVHTVQQTSQGLHERSPQLWK